MSPHSKRSSSGRTRQASGRSAGQVRIIAGRWRGRKLPVIDADGLRPTGDRVRETLFNWLQMRVPGAHCLDLFAGSGSLGLEAASREAASVVLVESNKRVADALRDSMRSLGIDERVSLHTQTADAFLDNNKVTFNLVFVDPPFDSGLQLPVVRRLCEGHLQAGALVYVEAAHNTLPDDAFPDQYEILKLQRFGDVNTFLLQYQ